jgi:lipopolysaccharide export system permease protein
MPLIERYIFWRTAHVFLLTLGALIAVLWVTQVLRELDVVTAKGQAIWVFVLMTAFALPALTQLVAPIAFLVGCIIALNSLAADSELPVISAAGASRKAVNRPILALALVVTLLVAISHHIVAPASLSNFRILLTQVRADVIATLAQEGGFRAVDEGLTMHFREKVPDGSFRDIFVNDERDPKESLTFSAARGMLVQHAGGSFLILQDGDLIREDRVRADGNVVTFETYALDLSQIGTPDAAPIYRAKERATLILLDPEPDDTYATRFPQRIRAEVHERITAPLHTLVFALIALAFLGQPRTNRQDRSSAIAAVVVLCLLFRGAGFAATAVSHTRSGGIPFMYAVPVTGIALGAWAITRGMRLPVPTAVGAITEALQIRWRRMMMRHLGPAGLAGEDRA